MGRAEQEKRCREKVAYLSRMCAQNAAFLLALIHPEHGHYPYRCPICRD